MPVSKIHMHLRRNLQSQQEPQRKFPLSDRTSYQIEKWFLPQIRNFKTSYYTIVVYFQTISQSIAPLATPPFYSIIAIHMVAPSYWRNPTRI
jgi:hypothetical protein